MHNLWNEMIYESNRLSTEHTVIYRKLQSPHNIYIHYNKHLNAGYYSIEVNIKESNKYNKLNCIGFSCYIENLSFMSSDSEYLTLSCQDLQSIDLFIAVISDITAYLNKSIKISDLCGYTYERIEMWYRFFQKNNTLRMSLEKQMGLYGELKTLEFLMNKFSLHTAINYWRGPFMEPHDFSLPYIDIETKTTTTSNPISIRIHGTDQLSTLNKKSLFLHVFNLEQSETTGESIDNIIIRIETKFNNNIKDLNSFHSLLLEYGYPLTSNSNPYRFRIINEYFYQVDESFPNVHSDNCIFGIEFNIPLYACESNICTDKYIYSNL